MPTVAPDAREGAAGLQALVHARVCVCVWRGLQVGGGGVPLVPWDRERRWCVHAPAFATRWAAPRRSPVSRIGWTPSCLSCSTVVAAAGFTASSSSMAPAAIPSKITNSTLPLPAQSLAISSARRVAPSAATAGVGTL
eukprot:5376173-Prymnesium_polylepis.1